MKKTKISEINNNENNKEYIQSVSLKIDDLEDLQSENENNKENMVLSNFVSNFFKEKEKEENYFKIQESKWKLSSNELYYAESTISSKKQNESKNNQLNLTDDFIITVIDEFCNLVEILYLTQIDEKKTFNKKVISEVKSLNHQLDLNKTNIEITTISNYITILEKIYLNLANLKLPLCDNESALLYSLNKKIYKYILKYMTNKESEINTKQNHHLLKNDNENNLIIGLKVLYIILTENFNQKIIIIDNLN